MNGMRMELSIKVESVDPAQMNSIQMLELFEFCSEAAEEDLPPAKNMQVVDYENKPETLLHKLWISKEYDRLFLGWHGERLVGISACYKLNNKVMICGCRSWTVPDMRTKYVHGNHIFPEQFKYAKNEGCHAAWFTFNDYNVWLYKFLKRISEGKATAFGMKNSDTYKDMTFVPGQMLIKNTTQMVAIKKL